MENERTLVFIGVIFMEFLVKYIHKKFAFSYFKISLEFYLEISLEVPFSFFPNFQFQSVPKFYPKFYPNFYPQFIWINPIFNSKSHTHTQNSTQKMVQFASKAILFSILHCNIVQNQVQNTITYHYKNFHRRHPTI